jgi:uncharacterized protein
MKIGLLSDTHSYIDDAILKHFDACDEIWHAGDIGAMEVLDRLKQQKPVRVVWGNIDDNAMRSMTKENLRWNCNGLDIWMTHIGGRPGNYATPVRQELKANAPGLFICGHSHICMVKFDPTFNMVYMNPGAAGRHGFHQIRTMLRFNVDDGKIANLEVIELGKRVEKI